MNEVKNLFISGMLRTGTTLLEKLLCNHTSISILSQPFPYIYMQVKREFLNYIDYGYTYYPLGNYFLEDKYTLSELSDFLDSYEFDHESLVEIFEQMREYSGQLMRFEDYESELEKISAHDFLNVFKSLQYIFRKKDGAKIYGSKEVLCEEFVPYFLQKDIKCIIIIRDPRAMIASLNYGKSGKYVGDIRPTLFNIRNWRKSVAFSLSFETDPQFLWIKYEDLVQDFVKILKRITNFLGIEAFKPDSFKGGIFDQDGKLWEGNSSYGEKKFISPNSIEKFKRLMPESMIKYIEATCFPEMRYLGYQLEYSTSVSVDASVIREFSEPFPVTRKEFKEGYSSTEENICNELERLNLLKHSGADESKIRQFFISDRTFKKLQNAVRIRM